MAAQNNTGMVITLSCFVLLSVVLGVFTYLTVTHNSELTTQLNTKSTEATESAGKLREAVQDLDTLKNRIGVAGEVTDIVTTVNTNIAKIAANGTATDLALAPALDKTSIDRDIHNFASNDRKKQLEDKTRELQETIQKKDAAIASHQKAASDAEAALRQKETQHSEELDARRKEIDELRAERNTLQEQYNTFKTQAERNIADLNDEIAQKRNAIVVLRQKLFEQEDLSFDRPDGAITFVDQNRLACYVDLGIRDELQVGTTFSVYTKNNNGVGRRNTEDVKGRIEIVALMGPHQSEARIVFQDQNRPIAAQDPIYSPLFTSGQKLEIAVAGLMDFDGNPGDDTDEFLQIVRGTRAKVAVRTNALGELVDEDGQPLGADALKTKITEKTRFLVIGDTGAEAQSENPELQAIYRKIQQNADKMRTAAESNGVYVISLSSFLEYIGYSKKRLAWSPTEPFPGRLVNGAKSTSVGAGLGSRQSSAAISGAFSSRKKVNAPSMGSVSGLYSK